VARHAQASAGSSARQRSHPFRGPLSAAHAPLVVVSAVVSTRQPARLAAALHSHVQVCTQPSVARTKLTARHPLASASTRAAPRRMGGDDGSARDGSQAVTADAITTSETPELERGTKRMRSQRLANRRGAGLPGPVDTMHRAPFALLREARPVNAG
jgi:hypothetical protein